MGEAQQVFATARSRGVGEVTVWRNQIGLAWDPHAEPELDQSISMLITLAYAAQAMASGRAVRDIRASDAAQALVLDPESLFRTRPNDAPDRLWSELETACRTFATHPQPPDLDLGHTPAGGDLTLVQVATPTDGPGWQWGRAVARAMMVLDAAGSADRDGHLGASLPLDGLWQATAGEL
jgi:hypothetical protein